MTIVVKNEKEMINRFADKHKSQLLIEFFLSYVLNVCPLWFSSTLISNWMWDIFSSREMRTTLHEHYLNRHPYTVIFNEWFDKTFSVHIIRFRFFTNKIKEFRHSYSHMTQIICIIKNHTLFGRINKITTFQCR